MSSITTGQHGSFLTSCRNRSGFAARVALIAVAIPILLACGAKSGVERKNAAPEKSFAAVPGSVLFIPASAHVSGALGTNWRTDLELLNPGTVASTVTVALLRADRDGNLSPTSRTINIEAGRSVRYTDVLSSLFGFSGAAALRIVNTDGMVAVTSRTYNLTSTGTFGQFAGGVLSPTAIHAGQEGRLIQLTHNRSTTSGFRTNIGFVNAGAGSLTIKVDLYSADGSLFGTRSYTLAGYEFRQIDKIYQQVTSSDVDDGYAVLSTPTSDGAFFAYATVIDNRTGDPVYITPAMRAGGGGATGPTATPNPTGQPTPTRTPTPSPTPAANANLAPYQPDGWSGPLVVSGTTGTSTSGGLSASGPTYIDGAVINNGPGSAVFAAGQAVAGLSVDGSYLGAVTMQQDTTMEEGDYAYFTDAQVTGIGAGSHTVTLTADPQNLIAESNESDNTYDYVGNWGAAARDGGENEMKAAPIPGSLIIAPSNAWSSKAPVRYPAVFEWQGRPLLKPGPMNGTKAVSYGDAVYIPASAHATGAAGTNWRTDVELHNPGSGQARYEIALLKRDQSNPSPQVRTYTVNAGRSLRLTDVLDSAFGFNGAAALRITPLSGDLIATSRTYNLQPDGTYGLFAGAVNEISGFASGERAVLMQLTHDTATATGFRTNVGMVNVSGATINLVADFRGANGTRYGTQTYTLGPYEYIQKDRIFRAVTSGAVADGYIIFTTQSTGGRFLAYATVVDNETGDSVFIPAISVLGQEPAAINTLVATQAAFETMGEIGQGQIPSIEEVVANIQAYGLSQVVDSVIAELPAGIVTHTPGEIRVDFGSHMVVGNGDILSGSIVANTSNVVVNSSEVSFDFSGEQQAMLWNGGFVEIDGLEGRLDAEVHGGGHVRGDLDIASFNRSIKTNGVTVTGDAHFDTEVCSNYPISGSLTVSKDGEDYTIDFNDACDGTFDAPNQGQTGDVSFRLTWNSPEDLDLYVTEPNGTTIYYGNRGPTSTGGQLDVDSNSGCNQDSNPTENVFWPVGSAPHGNYTFWVDRWSSCSNDGGSDTPSFTLQVFEGNSVVRTINGTMPSSGETEHYTHSF